MYFTAIEFPEDGTCAGRHGNGASLITIADLPIPEQKHRLLISSGFIGCKLDVGYLVGFKIFCHEKK